VLARPAASAVDSGGLVAAYGFDERAGDRTRDGSGRGRDAFVRGARRTAMGRSSRCLAFGGRAGAVSLPQAVTAELRAGHARRLVRPASKRRARTAFVAGDGRTLRPGRWSHLAVTYDGAALRFYVDGSTRRRFTGSWRADQPAGFGLNASSSGCLLTYTAALRRSASYGR
jgi:Concanavalin A-like lectin/glucanases superfamily